MKVLLLNPPQKHQDSYNEASNKTALSIPPLGLAYIAAVLEKEKVDVRIYDGQLQERFGFSELKEILYDYKPDIVGITSSTPTFHRAIESAKVIKEWNKNIPIIIGGPHANAIPVETLMSQPDFDFVIFGEGEHTMLELVMALEHKKLFSEIDGIAYREGGKVKLNKPRQFIADLDQIPFPARHLLPDNKKYNYTNFKRLPSIHMITSRGCPFNCIFCDHPFGKTVRMHSVDYTMREIEHLVKEYGVKDIQFGDENLMFDKDRLYGLCDRIIAKKLDISWSCFVRVDKADQEVFKQMRKAGCWMVSFGIESGNQDVLNFIKKGITLEKVRAAVKAAKKAGLEVRGSFMVGHPIDTKETINQTIKFVKSLNLDHAACSITVPYPGSELYLIAEKYGTFKKDDFTKYRRDDDNTLSFVPNGMTEKELILLHKKARMELYFCSGFIFRAIKSINSLSHLRRYLLGAYSLILGYFASVKLKGKNEDASSDKKEKQDKQIKKDKKEEVSGLNHRE